MSNQIHVIKCNNSTKLSIHEEEKLFKEIGMKITDILNKGMDNLPFDTNMGLLHNFGVFFLSSSAMNIAANTQKEVTEVLSAIVTDAIQTIKEISKKESIN